MAIGIFSVTWKLLAKQLQQKRRRQVQGRWKRLKKQSKSQETAGNKGNKQICSTKAIAT